MHQIPKVFSIRIVEKRVGTHFKEILEGFWRWE